MPQGIERVILLGCVKTKVDHRAKAKDLYASRLWRARRDYAERSGRRARESPVVACPSACAATL